MIEKKQKLFNYAKSIKTKRNECIEKITKKCDGEM